MLVAVSYMKLNKEITRKRFFNVSGALIFIALAALWHQLTRRNLTVSGTGDEITVPGDLTQGVSLLHGCVIIKKQNNLRAFSAECSHAGCLINQVEGTVLKCACHGSQFDALTGKPLKGPAIKPLKQLECRQEKKTGQWKVKRS